MNAPGALRRSWLWAFLMCCAAPCAGQAGAAEAEKEPLPEGAILRLGSPRLRHPEPLHGLGWSADGRLLATGGARGRVYLWSATSGRLLRRIAVEDAEVEAIALSPDRCRLAVAGNDGTACLVDTATGHEVAVLPTPATRGRAVAFSSKGDRLALAGDGGVRVWGLSATAEKRLFDISGGTFSAVAFSPDGSFIVAAEIGGRGIQVCDAATGKYLRRVPHVAGIVHTLAFSRDGSTFLVSSDCITQVWDGAGEKARPAFKKRILRGGSAAALSADGKVVATTDASYARACLWDATTAESLGVLVPGHAHTIQGLAFSPDGKVLAAASAESAIRLWDTAARKRQDKAQPHEELIAAVAWSPDGSALASAAWDDTVRTWDARTGKERLRLRADRGEGHSHLDVSLYGEVAFSPDGRLVAAVQNHDTVVIWDTVTGRPAYRFPGRCVAFAPDGCRLAAGDALSTPDNPEGGVVRLYALPNGRVLRELTGHRSAVGTVAFTPDGKSVLSRGVGHEGLTASPVVPERRHLRLWDVATGAEQPLAAPEGAVSVMALSPDGRTLATVARDERAIALWEMATGQRRGEWDCPSGRVTDLAFAPGGRALATAHEDGLVRLWDVFTGRPLKCLDAGPGRALGLAFSPDGKALATAGGDTTTLVWDVAEAMRGPGTRDLDDRAREACWADLRRDGAPALRAAGALAASPAQAVPFLRKCLRPAKPVDVRAFAALVARLDDDDFAEREKAMTELACLDERALPLLRKAEADASQAEARRRLTQLRKRLEEGGLGPEAIRAVRAVEVLEWAGTPQARELLGELAGGDPAARLTREAQGSRQRLSRP